MVGTCPAALVIKDGWMDGMKERRKEGKEGGRKGKREGILKKVHWSKKLQMINTQNIFLFFFFQWALGHSQWKVPI